MKTIVFSFLISVCPFLATAQSVVSSAGGGSNIVMWTVGELVTESIVRSDGYFTQGFNQAFEIGSVGIWEVTEGNRAFRAYPNPVADQLKLVFEENRPYSWTLYELGGKPIQQGRSADRNSVIDFSDRNPGKYMLKIVEGSKARSVVIIKN